MKGNVANYIPFFIKDTLIFCKSFLDYVYSFSTEINCH